MAEITAAELRRLRALERTLETARETAAKAKAENKELGTSLRQLEVRATAEVGKVDQVVEVNRGLAERLQNAEKARDAALEAAEGGLAAEREVDAKLRDTTAKLEEANGRIRQLEQEVDQLRTQTAAANAPAGLVTAPRLGHLLDEFISGVEQQAGGLQLMGGSLKLQVGLADTSAGAAFVIPSAGTPAERIGPLHEVVMSFDRSPAALRAAPEDEG